MFRSLTPDQAQAFNGNPELAFYVGLGILVFVIAFPFVIRFLAGPAK